MKHSKTPINKFLVLCADDYGQNKAINEGILLLAKNNRINAISCLVNSPHWPEDARELMHVKSDCLIGLHLNFTFGQALSIEWQRTYSSQFKSLSSLLKQAYLKRIDQPCVEAEILAQLAAFKQATGQNPDFIDGHQHVHQLPLIREALLSIYQQEKLTAFCRKTSNGWRDFLSLASFPKQQTLALLGGIRFKKRLHQQTIAANTSFAGIYNFVKAKNYRHYFQSFLSSSRSGGLIMCHPGMHSNDPNDPLSLFRHHELSYLMSEAFLADLNKEKCQLMMGHDCNGFFR